MLSGSGATQLSTSQEERAESMFRWSGKVNTKWVAGGVLLAFCLAALSAAVFRQQSSWQATSPPPPEWEKAIRVFGGGVDPPPPAPPAPRAERKLTDAEVESKWNEQMDAAQRELEVAQQIVMQKAGEVWEAAMQKLKRMWVEGDASRDADRLLLQREEVAPPPAGGYKPWLVQPDGSYKPPVAPAEPPL
jgi:hypothetical protein